MCSFDVAPQSKFPSEARHAVESKGTVVKSRLQRKHRQHLGSDSEDEAEDEVLHVHPKSDDLVKRMVATLAKKAPFEGHDESGARLDITAAELHAKNYATLLSLRLRPHLASFACCADLKQLVAAMAPVEVKAGTDVITEGETGDLAYWVDRGTLSVLVGGKEVDTITSDEVFGQVALVYDLERTATIRTQTDSHMWLLHRAMFQHILRDKAIADRKAKFTFLTTVKIFGTLDNRQVRTQEYRSYRSRPSLSHWSGKAMSLELACILRSLILQTSSRRSC